MLSSIRKFSSSIYAKILLGIVVIPFVFWGMGSSFRLGNKNVVVVIDKDKFSTQEFAEYVTSHQNVNEKLHFLIKKTEKNSEKKIKDVNSRIKNYFLNV